MKNRVLSKFFTAEEDLQLKATLWTENQLHNLALPPIFIQDLPYLGQRQANGKINAFWLSARSIYLDFDSLQALFICRSKFLKSLPADIK